jgi:hypothetical protein
MSRRGHDHVVHLRFHRRSHSLIIARPELLNFSPASLVEGSPRFVTNTSTVLQRDLRYELSRFVSGSKLARHDYYGG